MNPQFLPRFLNILHLEDDPLQSELLKTELEKSDIPCSITRVWTGDAFNAALTHGRVDVIVADWKTNWDPSGFDSTAALGQARQQCPGVPFIFFAQQEVPDSVMRAEAFSQGAADFISKSDMAKLVQALNWALQMKQRKQAQRPKPEVGEPVMVQCQNFRCLGYLDKDGKWRDYQTSEEIAGVIGWSAV